VDEFEELMAAPPRPHQDVANQTHVLRMIHTGWRASGIGC